MFEGFTRRRIEASEPTTINCPLLVLWGERNPIWKRFDMTDIWRQRAMAVTGEALACGHYLPEEAPDATCSRLRQFFS